MSLLSDLRAAAGVGSFLSSHNSNPKTAKAEKKLGIRTATLHLAPADLSGWDVCPGRSPGCTAACLHYSGSPTHMQSKNRARIARTKFFFEHRAGFLEALHLELRLHLRMAERQGLKPAARLNATSDIPWERIDPTLFSEFPQMQFYDYTAVLNRLQKPLPENYHLTFSLKEDNLAAAKRAVDLGFSLAVVFDDDPPDFFLGLPVIDGDEHDFRPTDPDRCIVGLRAKGIKGKSDVSGFVNRLELEEKLAA